MGSSVTTQSKIMTIILYSLYTKCCSWNSLPLKPAWCQSTHKIKIQENMLTETFILLMWPCCQSSAKDLTYPTELAPQSVPDSRDSVCFVSWWHWLTKTAKKAGCLQELCQRRVISNMLLLCIPQICCNYRTPESLVRLQAQRCLATALYETVAPPLT